MKIRTCHVCQAQFAAKTCGKTCSELCRKELRNNYEIRRREKRKHERATADKPEQTCSECSQVFTHRGRGFRLTCSDPCQDSRQSRERKRIEKRWRQANPEAVKRLAAKHRPKHREYMASYCREYYAKNRENILPRVAKRQADEKAIAFAVNVIIAGSNLKTEK